MDKVITYGLNEDFIGKIADYLDENFLKKGADVGRLAFVFGGKRPALFLRKALSKKTGKSFFSPAFFTIDEFMEYTLWKKVHFKKMPNMELWYAIYTIARDIAPEIVERREKFSEFMPWAREIANFIDVLDVEDIPSKELKSVEASASIGYPIPPNINNSLRNIRALRDAYHKLLSRKNSFTRGFIYHSASSAVKEVSFDEFDTIFFSGFFYMHKTEREVIKHLYDNGKAVLFFQGDEDKWPVLKETANYFSRSIRPDKEVENSYSLNFYSAFDRHSQVCTVREILKKTKKLDSTVVVLPDPDSMIPLVSEIGASAGDFNVSLGYPLRRSSLHSLFELILRAQKSRKGKVYYSRDYIAVLSQPLAKNLRILPDYSATRVLVHKIEETLLGIENSSISGNLFVDLKDVENLNAVFKLAAETLSHMGIEAHPDELRDALKELHNLLFRIWETTSNFRDLAASVGKFLDALVKKSFMANYPLNRKIADRLYSLGDEFENAPFSGEDFEKEDVFKIFQNMLEHEMVAFAGSPLRGLQILGTLETRSLHFENVIIMDANESKLPALRIYEPLIPGEVIKSLGLDRIHKEEEIQRYLFTRIISGAKNVHLVYEESRQKERSRFVEELIWKTQKEEKNLDAVSMPQVSFSVKVLPEKAGIVKTVKIVEYLKKHLYSPSSVDMYIGCPLRFYYRYVLGLKEKKELMEDVGPVDVGSFIHEFLEGAFGRFLNKKPRIDEKFRRDFFKMFDEKFEKDFGKRMRSDSFLVKDVMRVRLERFLDSEQKNPERDVKEILMLEKQLHEQLKLPHGTFNFTYKTDRIDRLEDGTVLIVDYKTGGSNPKPARIGFLEQMELNRESIRDRIRSFQLPLYYYFEKQKRKEEVLKAAFYNLRKVNLVYFPGKQEHLERTMEVCMKALDFILREIVNPQKEFAADRKKESYCAHCPFFYMCK